MSERLAGRAVLVCGAATGIGAAVARRVADEGAFVWLQYRTREEEARSVHRSLPSGRADLIRGDLTVEADVDGIVRRCGDVFGLVHAVSAPLPSRRFDREPWDEYERHFGSSVRSAYLLLRGALARPSPTLRSAVFVLTSATLSAPPPDWAPYLVAKHALWGLVRAAAIELGPKGVRVNAVSPAFTRTPLTEGMDPRIMELLERSIPMRRLGTPEDAAAAVAFLLSDDASFVTGANLPASGGVGL